jgi:hypothetical protein
MRDEVFALFRRAAPACVLIRGVWENVFSSRPLNAIFEDTSQTVSRQLLFPDGDNWNSRLRIACIDSASSAGS